jgi:hypothetical protein
MKRSLQLPKEKMKRVEGVGRSLGLINGEWIEKSKGL